MGARAERVACIGGARRDGVALVTRVRELRPGGADCTNLPSLISLAECRPPHWFGTVHTHIATFQGLPYTTFSAPDRDMMARWNHRWRPDGVFCALYGETSAYCEAGEEMTGDVAYSALAATRIMPQLGNVIGAPP